MAHYKRVNYVGSQQIRNRALSCHLSIDLAQLTNHRLTFQLIGSRLLSDITQEQRVCRLQYKRPQMARNSFFTPPSTTNYPPVIYTGQYNVYRKNQENRN